MHPLHCVLIAFELCFSLRTGYILQDLVSAMAYDAYVKMDFSKGGEDYPCMEKIYFALKSEMYEKAYQYVSRIIDIIDIIFLIKISIKIGVWLT